MHENSKDFLNIKNIIDGKERYWIPPEAQKKLPKVNISKQNFQTEKIVFFKKVKSRSRL